MRKTKTIKAFLSIGIIGVFISSCSIEKRQYMPGYHIDWSKISHVSESKINIEHTKKTEVVENTDSEKFEDENSMISASIDNNKKTDIASKENYILSKKTKNKLSFINQNVECDEIILKSGEIIKGKILEINDTEIKYKKCDNIEGPTISTNKKNIFMIKYANGSTDVINAIPNASSDKSTSGDGKKIEPMSIASFTSGVIALLGGLILAFIAETFFLGIALGVLLGILAIVFGIISLNKIKKNKEMLKGKEFAIIGIITGALALLAMGFLILNDIFGYF